MKRTVGILLDESAFRGIPSGHTGHEQLSCYNRSGEKLGLTPFYMTLRRTEKNFATGYAYAAKRYRLQRRPLPRVVHNRSLKMTPGLKAKLNRLARASIVFNRINRFSKYRIHCILARNSALVPYLPRTWKYTRSNLARAMGSSSALYVKPTSGSVGDGIMKIGKIPGKKGQWQIFWKKGKPATASAAGAAAFLQRIIGRQSYLIQEAIPLATWKGRPYDIRVTVQKNGSGQWQVTGMIAKIAAPGRHVTNVAKGGTARRCEELFQAGGLPVGRTTERIKHASLQIAQQLGHSLPHLADIGLDMGVDRHGSVKFIEMNGRDQRYSFKKAGMGDTFYQTYATPIKYAKRLLERR